MAGGKIYDSVASTDNHDTQLCLVRNFVSVILKQLFYDIEMFIYV